MELKVHHRSNVTLQPTQIRIVILAMFAGLVLYATVAYVLSRDGSAPAAAQAPVFAAVLGALGVAFLIAARVVDKVRSAVLAAPATDSAATDRNRLNGYLVAKLVKASLAEAFGLVGTTFLLVTGEAYFLAAGLIAVFCLIRLLPKPGELATFDHAIGPGASSHSRAIEP